MGSPAIPLQVQTPQIQSPLQTIGGLMQIRSAITENALRQAQVQQSQQQMQLIQAEQTQKNKDLADQNMLQSLEKDPDSFAKIYGGDLSPLAGKVQDKTLQAVQAHVNDVIAKKATTDKAQLENEQTAHGVVGQALDSLAQMRKPDGTLDRDQVNQHLPDVVQRLAPELKILGVDTSQVPKSIQSEDDLKTIAGRTGATAALVNAALGRKKQQAETQEAAGRGAESQATADKSTFELNLMKGAMSGSEDQAIEQRFAGNPEAIQAAKDAWRANLPGGVKQALDAVNKVYDDRIGSAKKIDAETAAKVAQGRAMIPVEAATAGAKAYAEIPARVQEQVQSQLALAKNSPDAFSQITDRSARTQAETNYEKDSKDYATAVGAAKQLGDFVSAAQSGNKAAPGLIPITEVRQLVNRVNRNELESVSASAGSALDRLQGFIGKYTEGQPIPPVVLKDISTISGVMERAARRTYEDKVAITNKTYGSKVEPIDLPSNASRMIRARDPQGNLHEAPQGTQLPAGWKLEP